MSKKLDNSPIQKYYYKRKCACAIMQEIETSNGNHSIRQRLPSRTALPTRSMWKFHSTFWKKRKPHHFHKKHSPQRSHVCNVACMKNWSRSSQSHVLKTFGFPQALPLCKVSSLHLAGAETPVDEFAGWTSLHILHYNGVLGQFGLSQPR